MWHSHGGGAVKLDSGFSCTGLVRVNWQHRSVTVFQGWAEGDPGVTLHSGCLGAGWGGGGGHWGGVY